MLRILLVLVMLLLAVPAAQAAMSCSVDIGDIELGAVDTLGTTATTSTSAIDVQCDGILPGVQRVTLCGYIGAGSGGSTAGLRLAQSAGNLLAFGLYSSAGISSPWVISTTLGVGVPQRYTLPVSNGRASGSMTMHASVPIGQATAAIGSYAANFTEADVVFYYGAGDVPCAVVGTSYEARDAFAVSGDVAGNCRLETSDLNFGTTGRIGDNIDAEATLDIVCTAGTGFGIAIDGGGSGDPAARLLRSGGNSVRYDLYSNAQRTVPWGMASEAMLDGVGDGEESRLRVYGRIPPQPAAAGAYTDTVVVTIVYD